MNKALTGIVLIKQVLLSESLNVADLQKELSCLVPYSYTPYYHETHNPIRLL